MTRLLPVIAAIAAIVVIGIMSTLFVVDERKQAIVLQFGEVKQIKTEPGLGFKLPFVQEVVYYEARILPLETGSLEVTPLDERRLVVDGFARWRIVDPVLFRQAVRTEAAAVPRLQSILRAQLREVLGGVSSDDVISPERGPIMTRIRDQAHEDALSLGVEVIDVRIRRTDLPQQNLQATFERMEAERQREAADLRARGRELAQEIRATADREAVELVSDAQRQSDIIRGEADAERNAIFAGAYGKDEEFFAFYRSLRAYERALKGENSSLVISPNSEFFEYLRSENPAGATAPASEDAETGPAAAVDPTGPGSAATAQAE